jgi:hypothetical protein
LGMAIGRPTFSPGDDTFGGRRVGVFNDSGAST